MDRTRAIGAVAGVMLVLAACGTPAASSTDSSLPSAAASATPPTTPGPTASAPPTATASVPVELAWMELTEAPVPFLHAVTTAPDGYLGVGMASESTDAEPRPAIWRSTDGVAWQERDYELPTGVGDVVEALYQVVETGSGFAGLGSPWYGVAVSEDGATWSYEPLGEGACPAALAADDEVLVAVGSIGPCGMGGGPGTPAIWVRDADGWTLLEAPVSAGSFIGVVATPSGFTAWGTVTASAETWVCEIGCTPDLALEPYANAPWSSEDGWTWRRASDASVFVGATIAGVAANDEVIAAVGWMANPAGGPERAAVWTSPDGDTWTAVEDELPFAGVGMQFGLGIGGGHDAIGVWARSSGETPSVSIWTSTDGRHWNGATELVTDLRGLSPLGSGLVAYGTVSRSDDGSSHPCAKDEVLAGTCRNVAAAWVYAAQD